MRTGSNVVLIVDDDDAVRRSLGFLLEVEGFAVRLYDRPEALLGDGDLPRRGCLVVDHRLPGMTGIDMIEVLRARGVTLPAILLNGRSSAELRRRSVILGVVKVLEKPLSDNALIETVRAALAMLD